jgi:hypothetical protein
MYCFFSTRVKTAVEMMHAFIHIYGFRWTNKWTLSSGLIHEIIVLIYTLVHQEARNFSTKLLYCANLECIFKWTKLSCYLLFIVVCKQCLQKRNQATWITERFLLFRSSSPNGNRNSGHRLPFAASLVMQNCYCVITVMILKIILFNNFI